MKTLIKNHLVVLALGAGLAGCAGGDSLLLAVANGYWQGDATTATLKCTLDANRNLLQGLLDIAPSFSDGTLAGQNYEVDMVVKWGGEENEHRTDPEDSFSNYGSASSTDLIVEEVELTYDFSYAPMAPPSAGSLPQRLTLPVHSWLSKQSKAGTAAVEGAGMLHFEMVSRAISSVLFDDADSDPTFGPLLEAPNLYPMNVSWRMRARSEAGYRFETNDYNYPIMICNDCTLNTCSYFQACYPMWQDQTMCDL